MGFISKKKENPIKPSPIREHKKAPKVRKLLRNSSIPDKIPPVIKEAVVEDDNSMNNEEQTSLDIHGVLDNTIKMDRTGSGEKTADSRASNSYLSESGPNNLENASNSSLQNRGISRTNSVPNSIRSSGRNSSVQSLTVIREQYCCCSKWTRCERLLGLTVGIMALVIVALLAVIGILSSNKSQSNFEGLTLTS